MQCDSKVTSVPVPPELSRMQCKVAKFGKEFRHQEKREAEAKGLLN